MTWYEVLLFFHVVAVIVWLGSGLLLNVLAFRAERAHDDDALRRVADDSAELSMTVFIPASLATLVFGVLLTIEGPWGADQLWIVLGLVGYAATFLTGILVMKPGSEKIAALVARDDGFGPEALLETRRLLTKGRADTVVIYLVVAVMTLKPTSDDVGLLAVMAAIVVASVAYVMVRLHAIDAEAEAGAPAAVIGS
jgi:uncharacterized membrane protein